METSQRPERCFCCGRCRLFVHFPRQLVCVFIRTLFGSGVLRTGIFGLRFLILLLFRLLLFGLFLLRLFLFVLDGRKQMLHSRASGTPFYAAGIPGSIQVRRQLFVCGDSLILQKQVTACSAGFQSFQQRE